MHIHTGGRTPAGTRLRRHAAPLEQKIPPTLNLETIAPEFAGLDLVPLKAKAKEVHVAMSNAFGFGGVNACLVFRGAPAET